MFDLYNCVGYVLGVQPISAYLYYSVFIPRLYLNQYRRIDKEKKRNKKQSNNRSKKEKKKSESKISPKAK